MGARSLRTNKRRQRTVALSSAEAELTAETGLTSTAATKRAGRRTRMDDGRNRMAGATPVVEEPGVVGFGADGRDWNDIHQQ